MKHSNWNRRDLMRMGFAASAAAALPGWARAFNAPASTAVSGADSLRAHAQARGLMYGAAVVPALLDVDGMAAGNSSDPYTRLVAEQCNILVAENSMKWGPLRPTADTYKFDDADRLVKFAKLAGQKVRGHNLCWHNQLPVWFKTTATKENAKKLLVDHIETVAGRYKGQIQSWDVVNEAVLPKDGRADGLRNTPWLELLGPDYIELAFETAAKADPAAKLTYNEYDIELDTPEQEAKRGATMMLLRRLKARNVPVQALGIQSHLKADGPQAGAGLQKFIRELKQMGLEVYVTEMDVNTKGIEGGPDAQDAAVAKVYRDYLGLVLPEPNVKAVLTWGITDKHTWLNSRAPWAQRKDAAKQRPLPFDDELKPTPAFEALRAAIDDSRKAVAQKATGKSLSEMDPEMLYKPFAVPGSPAPAPVKTFASPKGQ